MKNNKGFTLIELLAVILILGIIALIAIPTVTSVVEESRKGAFENTVSNLIKEIENECMQNQLSGGTGELTITFTNGVATPSINMKGSLPDSGYIISNTQCKIRIVINDNNYSVEKDFEDDDFNVLKNNENINHTSKKEIIVSNLTSNADISDYNAIKSGATEKNSIIVKVYAAGKTFTTAGNAFADTKNSHKWIISVHGYTMSEFGTPASRFHKLGNYNVVAPRMYYWGNGTVSNNADYTWGLEERNDLHDVINYIISIDSEAEIVLYGGSMGGATVGMLSGDILPSNVKGIILDSGYTSVQNEMDYLATEKNDTLKAMAISLGFDAENMTTSDLKEMMINQIEEPLKEKGYTVSDLSVINQVKKATVPMLFMHGTDDDVVNPNSAQILYDSANHVSKKSILITEGACHTCASYLDEYTTDFYNKIKSFLSDINF